MVVAREPPKLGNETEIKSDYARSEGLTSCSFIDEDELATNRPKYLEFNEECNMKIPQFKIRMNFRTFKQFHMGVWLLYTGLWKFHTPM